MPTEYQTKQALAALERLTLAIPDFKQKRGLQDAAQRVHDMLAPGRYSNNPVDLVPVLVELGDGENAPQFPAYHDGKRWNGWAKPWFTEETVLKIRDWIAAQDPHEWDDLVIEHHAGASPGGLFTTFEQKEHRVRVPAREFRGRQLYGLGNGSWTWELVREYYAYQIFDPAGDASSVHDEDEFVTELMDTLLTQPDNTELRVQRWKTDERGLRNV